MVSYIRVFEVVFSNFTINIIGYICGAIKMLNTHDCFLILNVVSLLSMSGAVFRELARHPLDWEHWAPTFVGIVTQFFAHVLVGIFIMIFSRKPHRTYQLLKQLLSIVYTNCLYFAYPIVQTAYGDKYAYIPVHHAIVYFLFVQPIHTIIAYVMLDEKNHGMNDDEVSDEIHGKRMDDIEDGMDDGPGVINPVTIESNDKLDEIDKDGLPTSVPGGIEQPLHEEEQSKEDSQGSETNEPEVNPDEETNTNEEAKVASIYIRPKNVRWAVFWAFMRPTNIFMILGIIWSAIGWKMPLIIESLSYDFEKAVFAAGLFSTGIFVRDHPFLGFEIPEVIICLALHYIAMPLLAALSSFILQVDNATAQISTLVYAMPVATTSYVLQCSWGMRLTSASYTFVWSALISVPIIMLWIVVFNEVGLFKFTL